MNLSERRKFIRALTNSVKQSLLAKARHMPAHWDGIELRELIADTFDRERSLSTCYYWNDSAGEHRDRKRLKAYKQDAAMLG